MSQNQHFAFILHCFLHFLVYWYLLQFHTTSQTKDGKSCNFCDIGHAFYILPPPLSAIYIILIFLGCPFSFTLAEMMCQSKLSTKMLLCVATSNSRLMAVVCFWSEWQCESHFFGTCHMQSLLADGLFHYLVCLQTLVIFRDVDDLMLHIPACVCPFWHWTQPTTPPHLHV